MLIFFNTNYPPILAMFQTLARKASRLGLVQPKQHLFIRGDDMDDGFMCFYLSDVRCRS